MRSTTFLIAPLIIISLLLGIACQTPDDLGESPDFYDNLDSVSYSLGYFYGSQMANEGIDDFNYRNFAAGLRQGIEEIEPELDDMEMNMALQTFQMSLQERLTAEREGAATANIEEGERFLAENAERDDVMVTESGLQYRVIEEGDGESPDAQSTVRVHYTGTLISGEEFDSSRQRGEPIEFPLQGVIAGWTEGVQLMNEGATYEFFIPAFGTDGQQLGYGNNPPQGSPIPPGAVLIFEVELIEIVD